MRKRTRIAVVAALLFGLAATAVTGPDHRQVAQASTVDGRTVFRLLDNIVPRTGWTRTGRPAYLTPQQRWKLAKVACTANSAHDNVYEYEPLVDALLTELDLPNPYRYQDPVLVLSRRLHQYKERAGLAYTLGSQIFCDTADRQVEWHAAGSRR
jgi:hypothetical protein